MEVGKGKRGRGMKGMRGGVDNRGEWKEGRRRVYLLKETLVLGKNGRRGEGEDSAVYLVHPPLKTFDISLIWPAMQCDVSPPVHHILPPSSFSSTPPPLSSQERIEGEEWRERRREGGRM